MIGPCRLLGKNSSISSSSTVVPIVISTLWKRCRVEEVVAEINSDTLI